MRRGRCGMRLGGTGGSGMVVKRAVGIDTMIVVIVKMASLGNIIMGAEEMTTLGNVTVSAAKTMSLESVTAAAVDMTTPKTVSAAAADTANLDLDHSTTIIKIPSATIQTVVQAAAIFSRAARTIAPCENHLGDARQSKISRP